MDIGDFVAHFRDRDHLQKMIDKLGKTEAVQRLAWLHEWPEAKVAVMADQFLTGDYVDDRGEKGGRYFWGDL